MAAGTYGLKAVISASVGGMIAGLRHVQQMSATTRKHLAEVGSAAAHLSNKIGLPFAALGAIAGGFSLSALRNATVSFAEFSETVIKGAAQAGISTDEYQRLGFVTKMAGVDMETVSGSFGKLNRVIGEAAHGGNKNAAGLLKKLGVDTRDANGHLRSAAELLPELSDAFERNKNPVVQAQMGMALFGKSWQAVIPLLNQGSKGINENLERFKKIKGIISPEELESGKKFGELLKQVGEVAKGFGATVAKNLIPVLEPLLDDLITWSAANKKLIGQEVSKMAKDLAAWLKKVDFKSIAKDVVDLVKGVASLVDKVGGARNALIALVLFINADTILAIGGLIASCWRLGVALTANIAGPAIARAFAWLSGQFAAMALAANLSGVPLASWAASGLSGLTKLGAGLAASTATIATWGAGLLAAAAAGYAAGTAINYACEQMAKGTVLEGTGTDYIGGGIAHVGAFLGFEDAKEAVALAEADKKRRAEGWDPLVTKLPPKLPPGAMQQAAAPGQPLVQGKQVPSLINPPQAANSTVTVDFKNAPAGMQVTNTKTTGPAAVQTNVGYRSYAFGGP